MAAPAIVRLQKPRTDDRLLWDVLFSLWGYPAILVAHEMKLFETLEAAPLSLDGVCTAMRITRRPAEALLAVCTSCGLIAFENGKYFLTATAQDFLIPRSPTYFGWLFDVSISSLPGWVRSIRRAVQTDRPQGLFGTSRGAFAAWHGEQAESLTRAMHSASIGSAMAWPAQVDLSQHRVMLDIGGGSGAHSLGAVAAWPSLRAIVLDRPEVCAVARRFAAQHGLSQRVTTQEADFFRDAFPPADLHFYGNVFHDWPLEQCQLLAEKSFGSLPTNGCIVIHEVLFNDDRTGPFPAAAFSLDMLVTMHGQQYSGRQVGSILTMAGFKNVYARPTVGYWSIVTGVKP